MTSQLRSRLPAPPRGSIGPLVLLVAMVGCADEPRHRDPPLPPCGSGHELNIVAHEDDDLLFQNPDIQSGISGGATVRTVYITAGDAGEGPAYWSTREEGIRDAYAMMAGVPNAWREGLVTAAGKQLVGFTLIDAPEVSVVFMRLPDGGGNLPPEATETLKRLWDGTLEAATTVDDANTFTRAELIAALAALIDEHDLETLRMQDSIDPEDVDHTDHVHGAKFAEAANAPFMGVHAVGRYRGYGITTDPENLDEATRDLKWRVFLTYAAHDALLCDEACLLNRRYGTWGWRQYGSITPPDAPICTPPASDVASLGASAP